MDNDTTSIDLKLSGDDISPENVRMSTLLSVLGGLERAIEAMAEEMGIEFGEHEAIIIPHQFRKSSLHIPGSLNYKARDPLLHIDRAFYANEVKLLPSVVRSELRELQSTLGARGIRLDVTGDGFGLRGLALTEDAPPIADSDEVTREMNSHAVVYGVCMRVNRSRHDASVELHDGQSCSLKNLTDEHLRKLMQASGENLDQVYRIEGEATWSLDDYRISKIEVASITPVERKAGKLFAALREATGETFDGVDPIDYVNELRGK